MELTRSDYGIVPRGTPTPSLLLLLLLLLCQRQSLP
jgi:hypothetical protein